MKRLDGLALPQRVVLVVSWAAFLWLAARYVLTELLSDGSGGWFAYAPNTGAVLGGGDDLTAAEHWGVCLGALVVWTVGSLVLLRPAGSSDRGVEPD